MKKKELIKFVVKIGITILLVWILLQNIETDMLFYSFKHVDYKIFIFAFVMYMLVVVSGAIKWSLLLEGVAWHKLVKTTLKAQFFSTVLPGQLFGEASKIAMLHGDNKTDGEVTSSVVIDKITGLVAVTVMGIVGIIFTKQNISIAIKCMFGVLFMLLILGLLFPKIKIVDKVLQRILSFWENNKNNWVCKIGGQMHSFYAAWKFYAQNKRIMFWSLFWGFIVQLLGVLQQYGISLGLNIDVSIVEFFWIYSFLSVILLLPISVAGLGVREVSLVGFLGLFNVSSEYSITLSVIILSAQLLGALLGAIIIVLENIMKSHYVSVGKK